MALARYVGFPEFNPPTTTVKPEPYCDNQKLDMIANNGLQYKVQGKL